MRRLLASLVALAVVLSMTTVSSLHVHAYADHDDSSHDHGLASHEHHASSSAPGAHDEDPDHETAPHIEACEPDLHVVPITTLGCADEAFVPTHLAPVPERLSLPVPASRSVVVAVSDVRVHGPPGLRNLPPRAPPSLSHA